MGAKGATFARPFVQAQTSSHVHVDRMDAHRTDRSVEGWNKGTTPLAVREEAQEARGRTTQRALWDAERTPHGPIDVYASESDSDADTRDSDGGYDYGSTPHVGSVEHGTSAWKRPGSHAKAKTNFIQMRVEQAGTDAALQRYGLITEDDMKHWSCWKEDTNRETVQRPHLSLTKVARHSNTKYVQLSRTMRVRKITNTKLVQLSSYTKPPLVDQKLGSRVSLTYEELQAHKTEEE